mgnify:CR=1 FL=1
MAVSASMDAVPTAVDTSTMPAEPSHVFLCERWQGYGGLFVQKAPGEIKKSLLLLFLTDAALVALCWGGFSLPWVAVSAILMWGD